MKIKLSKKYKYSDEFINWVDVVDKHGNSIITFYKKYFDLHFWNNKLTFLGKKCRSCKFNGLEIKKKDFLVDKSDPEEFILLILIKDKPPLDVVFISKKHYWLVEEDKVIKFYEKESEKNNGSN